MEYEIYQMLHQTPGVLYSAKEVGRRIDRDEYRKNPSWARPHLESLLRQGSIEADENSHFFYPIARKLGSLK
jgi:hypothetical protein